MTYVSQKYEQCDGCGKLFFPGEDGSTCQDHSGERLALCEGCFSTQHLMNCSKCNKGWFNAKTELDDAYECPACRGMDLSSADYNAQYRAYVPQRPSSVGEALDWVSIGLSTEFADTPETREARCRAVDALLSLANGYQVEKRIAKIADSVRALVEHTEQRASVLELLGEHHKGEVSNVAAVITVPGYDIELPHCQLRTDTLFPHLSAEARLLRTCMDRELGEITQAILDIEQGYLEKEA